MKLRTIELFAGIGGFRLAADACNLTTVFANDIDEKACLVYKNNFGESSIIKGDIRNYMSTIPEHEVLTGGFPCQPFSKAGKKQGIEDYRGTLFEIIVQIISEKQPKYFILENVNSLLYMDNGRHFRTILSALSSNDYKIEWRVYNAQQFGLPQNRERVIIIGVKNISPTASYFFEPDDIRDINQALTTKIACYSLWDDIIESSVKFESWGMALHDKFITAPVSNIIYADPKILRDVLESNVDESFDFTQETIERIKNSQYINKFYNNVQILYNQSGGARMGYSIFGVDGVAPTLTASTSRHYERYKIDDKYRRLTNIEYARIQGFPDYHCAGISPYNQYKLFGNAVPPQLISFVLKRVLLNDPHFIEGGSISLLDYLEV